MAAGPIFNAIADLTRVNQHGTIERIVSISGATTANVVASLKANSALLVLADENVRLNITYNNSTDRETAITAAAAGWNNT